ncbi:hypothetical protein, conserved [Eimeria brunetti]|uniref:Uncharacterized protein n=1 Tax=Eimeria brunetti TaxID=51314 RepID=U6LJ32_9EIME|nr:hypothetical protein, conserved [Eimeria brunetti]
MRFASALALRQLEAALRSLGLNCVLPAGGERSRKEFILTTLLKLQYLIEPQQFSAERHGGEGEAELPQAAEAGSQSDLDIRAPISEVLEAKSPKDQLKLLQRLAAFMLQRVGVALDLQALFRAEADAISELLRLTETLADAARRALQGQTNTQAGGKTVQLQAGEGGGGGIRIEKRDISQTV